MEYLYLLLVLITGLLFPVYGAYSSASAKRLLTQYPEKKIGVYQETILIQCGLSALVMAAMIYQKDDIGLIGLSFLFQPLGLLSLIIFGGLLYFVFQKIEFSSAQLKAATKDYQTLAYFLPQSPVEYKWAVITAFAVSVLEEVLFRGFIYWQLSNHIPIWTAVLLTNLLFSIAHWGTGRKNALTTFFLGLFWSILFLLTGSLWLPILIHLAIDLYAIRMAYQVLGTKR